MEFNKEVLWDNLGKFRYLFFAAIFLLFTLLGAREIWTQEHRWAEIVTSMFYRNDFLHPYLDSISYYDKPLLSYWLIVLATFLNGKLTTWTLRLPSALAGLLTIWTIYRLGKIVKNKELGLLAGWLLLTTYYFLFWSRISSADMLNVAGSLLAVLWYFEKRDTQRLVNYSIFFIIIALTSLCKGLVGAVVPFIAVFTDICLQRRLQKHLNYLLLLALIPAFLIYILPFWASSYFGSGSYGEDGLYLVYRENILRYFQPFDHKEPIYLYFIYLPIYLLPWTGFFIPAVFAVRSRWANMTLNEKWIVWTLLLLFLFFSFSGSRRSYYILPVVPFAVLFTADWILAVSKHPQRQILTFKVGIFAFIFLFLLVDVGPAIYYARFGLHRFSAVLMKEAEAVDNWDSWHFVMLDAESKLKFYLRLPPKTKYYDLVGVREKQSKSSLQKAWPILTDQPAHTIFISRKMYATLLKDFFKDYHMVYTKTEPDISISKKHDMNAPIAFIPNK